MRCLIIETASRWCSIALAEDGALVAYHHEVLGRGHAERLLPAIAALPDGGRAHALRVNRGPGSFTGVRIGLVAARALGLAWGAPVHAYDGLVALSAAAQAADPALARWPHAVAVPGGHGEFFLQRFAPDAQAVSSPVAMLPEDARAYCAGCAIISTDADVAAALDPVGHSILLEADARHALLLQPEQLFPDGAPAYVRPPDATPAKSLEPRPLPHE